MQAREKGLEDVVAAESAITWIDGSKGELRFRGYDVGELADACTFEQVAFLVWNGELPSEEETRALSARLRSTRVAYSHLLALLEGVPPTAHPLDVLRYVLSSDALRNERTWNNSADANRIKAIEFTAWFPVVMTALHRLRSGLDPVAPREDLDTAAQILYMLYGKEADPIQVRTLETWLVLHVDHELNASTFAARVTIATQSNLHAAVASALGTLSGPRHGGASDRVVQMLEEIGSPEHVEEWVAGQLAQKQRIMGFGHRVYRTVDPRSRNLRIMAEQMLRGTSHEAWTQILTNLSNVMEREKGLYPNVDLYAAVVNRELGLQPAFYTSLFACSRIVGWTAHAIEQLQGRMIRPVADYRGPNRRALPLEATV